MATRQRLGLLLFSALIQIGFGYNGQPRIVGGSPAQEPISYQVSLQAKSSSGLVDQFIQMMLMQSRSDWTHYCGGVIIGERHCLTAAHCAVGADLEKISVLAGTSSRLRGGNRYMIESVVIHPDYAKLQSNDIAVIKIKSSFAFNSRIGSINFQDPVRVPGDVKVKLSGWGYTTPLAILPLPVALRTIDLTTLSNEECQDRGHNVSETEICTNSGILRGACMGDSGGPLVDGTRTKLIGLVSRGPRLCGSGRPVVYTRVSAYIPWIEEQVRDKTRVPDDSEKPVIEIPPPEPLLPAQIPSDKPSDDGAPMQHTATLAPSSPAVIETAPKPPSMESLPAVATTLKPIIIPTTLGMQPVVEQSVTLKPSMEKPTTTSDWLVSAFTPIGGVPAEILVPTTTMPALDEAPVIPPSPVAEMPAENTMEATTVKM